jgi:uncharacterized protein (DUF433 family)
MKRFVISILIVVLVAGGLVSVASGAGQGNPLSSVNQGIDFIRGSLEEAGQAVPAVQRVTVIQPVAAEGVLQADEDLPQDEWVGPTEWYVPWGDGYCDGTATEPHPILTKLAEQFGVTYDELLGWYCQGFGSGQIALAYMISQKTGVPVADIFAMRESGMSWEEILVELGLLPEDFLGNPMVLPGQRICMDETQHPLATRLAEKLGVSLDEIKDMFCSGYGFGEIEQVYAIAQQMGVPVSEIIALRQNGLGWGEIRDQFGLNGNQYKLDKPGKPDKQENPELPTKSERPVLPLVPRRGR